MRPDLFHDISRNLAEHEGRELSMYRDTVGVVTCGIGHALFNPLMAYQCVWWKETNVLASRAEVLADYNYVKTTGNRGKLFMTYEESDKLLAEDLGRFELTARKTFPMIDSYPYGVQIALYDICFNCGSFREWPKLTAAVLAEDWQAAANESNRPQVSEKRNADTRQQFLHGIIAV